LLKEAMVERLVSKEEKGADAKDVIGEALSMMESLKSGKPLQLNNGSSYELVDEATLLKLLNDGAISEGDIIKEINGKTLIRIRRVKK